LQLFLLVMPTDWTEDLAMAGGQMLVGGVFVSTIGNICMDMCMLDITGRNIQEGDEVVVFGKQYTIKEMAAELKTIPYEILSSISARVKRIYLQE
jgi:Alr-MurF fusion protein